MRRQRELLFAQNERTAEARAAAASKVAPAAAKAPVAAAKAPVAVAAEEAAPQDEAAPAAAPSGRRARGAAESPAGKIGRPGRGGDEQGACSVCGKQRPLQGGMVSSHQKGFGKMCPGSRKPPAGA